MLLMLLGSIPEIWTFCPTKLAASCNCIPSRVAKLPSVKDRVKSPPATKENSHILYIFQFLYTKTKIKHELIPFLYQWIKQAIYTTIIKTEILKSLIEECLTE